MCDNEERGTLEITSVDNNRTLTGTAFGDKNIRLLSRSLTKGSFREKIWIFDR